MRTTAARADRHWEAVRSRDAAFDGRLFFAVTTTGVYCRPSCPARRPLRENVRFFESSGESEAAGFRACKRCAPSESLHATAHDRAIREACRTIEGADPAPTLSQLAAIAGMSAFHFQRVFKKAVGLSPKQYAGTIRSRRLKTALQNGGTVTRATLDAGVSTKQLYVRAPQDLGMSASAYRAGGAGLTIRYALAKSPLGLLLAARTERGICAIEFGGNPIHLVKRLRARFPAAQLRQDTRNLKQALRAITHTIQVPRASLVIPLDVRGTAFQQRVWQALQKITVGQTRSYAQIARDLGHPTASRAVAAACAANPVALAIPCHRAVRADGQLAGYRWGIRRKRRLLRAETESTAPKTVR